ncbi:unknown [Prevotella sp. CAG:924]|nr:unknown [Prevotella sp. CAG:924]
MFLYHFSSSRRHYSWETSHCCIHRPWQQLSKPSRKSLPQCKDRVFSLPLQENKARISEMTRPWRKRQGHIDRDGNSLAQKQYGNTTKKARPRRTSTGRNERRKWYLLELNQGHMDFQSIALPPELRHLDELFLICGCKGNKKNTTEQTFSIKNARVSEKRCNFALGLRKEVLFTTAIGI